MQFVHIASRYKTSLLPLHSVLIDLLPRQQCALKRDLLPHLAGSHVEFLAEIHHVDAERPEGLTHSRRRLGGRRAHLQTEGTDQGHVCVGIDGLIHELSDGFLCSLFAW